MNSSSSPPLGDDQMQQAEREREIGAGPGREMQVGLLGGAGAARIDDDQRAAVLPQFGQIAQRGRHGLREVRADEDHAARPRDVLQREGQPAVEAERPAVRRRRPTTCRNGRCSRSARCPARPARTCPARTPSRSSGRPRRTRPPRPGRAPLRVRSQLPRRSGPAPPPRWRAPAAPVTVAHQRLGQAYARREHGGRGAALAAQRAPVDRERGSLSDLHTHLVGHRRAASCRTAGRSTGSAYRFRTTTPLTSLWPSQPRSSRARAWTEDRSRLLQAPAARVTRPPRRPQRRTHSPVRCGGCEPTATR